MDRKRAGSLRTASVGFVRFGLERFERNLSGLIGFSRENPGQPGGCDPVFSNGLGTVISSYLLSELFSKFDDGRRNESKESTTWERFHEAEALCRETNERLAVTGFKGPFEQEILLAKKIAALVLGPFSLNAMAGSFGWGPGSTTRVRRSEADAAYKYSGKPETTYNNAAFAEAAIRCNPLWTQSILSQDECPDGRLTTEVPGNRVVTVPKNYKTDRTIAIEPCMNIFVQKGIGAVMRRRLNAAGCNLNDQTRNQRLARIGALSGLLATVDLSMASDTLSREFVSRFIRADWLMALEQSRSQFGVLPSGEKIFYQKFSSMGNGYTFELESLIFYSLALAHCRIHGAETQRVSVYGDDIIIPSAVTDSFLALLRFCGFKPNEKKTHKDGSFRESCGKHYFLEHDVTPFYVRKPVSALEDLFLVHNNLYRWVLRVLPDRFEEFVPLLKSIRRLAPAKWRRARLPDGFGDGAFIGTFDEACPRRHQFGWEAWVISIYSPFSKRVDVEVPGLLPKAFDMMSARDRDLFGVCPPGDRVEVHPTRVAGHREKRITVAWSEAKWPFPAEI